MFTLKTALRTAHTDAAKTKPLGKEVRMTKREVSFSDLSGQMAEAPDGLIPLIVTDHPDLDEPRRIEVTRDELEKIGKLGIAAIGLETEPIGEDERRTRYVVPLGKFASLATVAPLDEVLGNAELATPQPKPRANGERRSHNRTSSGEALVNYGDPQSAGLPHNGKIGKREQDYVQANLEEVNARRTTAGHPPIDPSSPVDAERYGFVVPEQEQGDHK
jgi:hypothetical protein